MIFWQIPDHCVGERVFFFFFFFLGELLSHEESENYYPGLPLLYQLA